MENNKAEPIVTIGLPVFNGEKTIDKVLNSILKQSFTNFNVIISDNCSTDNTEKICKEFSKKDSRVSYIRQPENRGPLFNFKFVLTSAESKYFVWLSADDWWEPTFLEKNISFLESNKKFVGSIGKIDYYDIQNEYEYAEKKAKSRITKYYSYDESNNLESYVDRVSFYLRLNKAENIYGLFRKDILIKCVQQCFKKVSVALDLKLLLFIQRYGEINVLDEILMHRSGKGVSSKYSGKKTLTDFNDAGILGIIFPYLSFSIWILRKIGIKIFLKNLDYLLFINGAATKYQLKQFLKRS